MSFLKNFFALNKSGNGKFIYNFLLSLSISLFIFAPDYTLLLLGKISFVKNTPIIIALFLFSFLLAFSGKILQTILVLFILVIQIMNVGYLVYSGMQIGPTEIDLAFYEKGDVLMLSNILPFLWLVPVFFVPFGLILFLMIKYRHKMLFSPFCFIVVVLVVIWMFQREYNKSFSRAQPYPSRMTIHNSLNIFPYVITHIGKIENVKIPKEFVKTYDITKVKEDTPRLIVMIYGESTNWVEMKLLNEKLDRNTTPKLIEMFNKDKDRHLAMRAIGSGASTTSAHPLFWNMINTPTDVNKIIMTKKQNIIELAKKNGYKTHFISAQVNKYIEIAGNSPDDVVSAESPLHIKSFQQKHDDHLIELFDKMDLSQGKHFVVLHPYACHTPYDDNWMQRGKDKYRVFNSNRKELGNIKRDEYHNCMLYLDDLLAKLFEMAKEKGADYIFFTPDHSEVISNEDGTPCIDKNCVYGHVAVDEKVIRIPFLAYSKDNFVEMKQSFSKHKITSHYEIGKYLAHLIGYEVVNPLECENDFYVHAPRALGDYQLMKLTRDDDKIIPIFKGVLSEFVAGGYNECGKGDIKTLVQKKK